MSWRDSGPGEPQDKNDNWRGGGTLGGMNSGGSGLGGNGGGGGGPGGPGMPGGFFGSTRRLPRPGINWDDPRIHWSPVPPAYDPLSSISRPPGINWDNPNIHWSPVGGGLPSGIDQNVNQNNQGDPNHTADPGRFSALPPALPPAPAPAPAAHPAHQAFQNFFNNATREGGGGGWSAMNALSRSPGFSGGGSAMSAPGGLSGGWGGGPMGATGTIAPKRGASFSRPSIFGSSGEGFFGDRR